MPPAPDCPVLRPGDAFARRWAALNQRSAVPAVPGWNLQTGFARSAGALSHRLGVSSLLVRRLRSGIGYPAVLAYVLLCFVLSGIAVDGTWGFPFGWTVHVSADGRSQTYRSFRRTVAGVLAARRIVLRDGDLVSPPPDTVIWPGIQIEVVRAVPVVLSIGGLARPARVAATTVAGALESQGISLRPLDRVYPRLSAALEPGMTIRVERREWRSWVERRQIPFPSRVVADPDLFKGNRLLRSSGQPGVEERTVRVLYEDGHPVTVAPLAWAVVRPPVPRVTAVGTRAMIASRGTFVGREYLVMEATAYYPGPNNYGGGVGSRTATGMLAQRGVVAVDPSVIPLGSHLFIEGYGYAVAADTGGAIRGLRIDLCYNTYDEAIHFGRRPVTVYLLDKKYVTANK